MFWHVLLAHFLADYPLQTDWMVAHKLGAHKLGAQKLGVQNFWSDRQGWLVLLLHVGIHLLVMAIITFPAWWVAWPYLVLLAGLHFVIDVGKSALSVLKPGWVVGPYWLDQGLHLLSIAAVAAWAQAAGALPALLLADRTVIVLLVFLVVTDVWYISERVMAYRSADYRREVVVQAWPRMLARVVFLLALLWADDLILPALSGPALAVGLISLPYRTSRFGRRALAIDLLVSSGAFVFLVLAT